MIGKIFGQFATGAILLVAVLHILWAITLVFSPSGLGSTPVSGVYHYIHFLPYMVAVFLSASLLALYAVGKVKDEIIRALFLMPQQALLLFSAFAAINAITTQHYADGVMRPLAFILTDQMPVVLLTIGHSLGLIYHDD